MDESLTSLPTVPDRVIRILVGQTDEIQGELFSQAWKRAWGPRVDVRHVLEISELYDQIVDFKPDLLWASPTFLALGQGDLIKMIRGMSDRIRDFAPEIKFIIISHRFEPLDETEFQAMRIDGFLLGPCHIRDMQEAVAKLFPNDLPLRPE